LTQLVKQAPQQARRSNPQNKPGHAKNDSTFEQGENRSAHISSHFQNTRRLGAGQRRDEGISLSSGFSSASARGGNMQDTSTREVKNHHNDTVILAQQLSRTYFLNTKQLLRHLSPKKDRKAEGNETQMPGRQANHKQSIS
jgi:hypothetical protein